MKNYMLVFLFIALSVSCGNKETDIPDPVSFSIDCNAAAASTPATVDYDYTGTLMVPYAGGTGNVYTQGTPIESTGVTGLTATLQSGTLTFGSGHLTYEVNGKPASMGNASFAISFGSETCSISLQVTDLSQYGTPFTGVPDPRDAIIYQVNMRVFSPTRNFQGVINRLDSIKALGVNVIYLMPVYPVGVLDAINSPYCIKNYRAVNPEFGTLTDLRSLIDGAHSRGMAVIMDWVANHTAWDHEWISEHKEWYEQDANGNIVSPPMGWNDVAQLNFDNTALRAEMIRCMKYWVYTANCDGFRFDHSDGPPEDFWMQAIDTLRNITTHNLLLLAESDKTSNYAAGFDYIFGFGFYYNLKSIYSNNVSVQTINNFNNSEYNGVINDQQQVVRYISNHDVTGTTTPIGLFGGNPGSMAAFVVTATMKGVPMIYNGQEVGNSYPLPFPFMGTTINWNQNQSMVEEYKKILAFRNNSDAVRRGTLTSYSNSNICAFTKEEGTELIFVASNLRNTSITYPLPASVANSNWTDAMNGGIVTLTDQLLLQPYSYIVLIK
jgi:glycosidase